MGPDAALLRFVGRARDDLLVIQSSVIRILSTKPSLPCLPQQRSSLLLTANYVDGVCYHTRKRLKRPARR